MLGMVLGFASQRAASRMVASARCFSGSSRPQKHDEFVSVISAELEKIRAAGTFKTERVITSPQRSHISVAGSSKPVLNFCANNYLGLSDDTTVVAAAEEALKTHGFGLSSVRFICGTQDLHKSLEKKISDFHTTEDTILYASCFDANAGIFEGLLGAEDAIISDELNHASIIDGIRLCKAQRYRFSHMDMNDLEVKLAEATAAGARLKMIATDGVFSMDGDIAPLSDICDLADKYNALVFVDECHATGFMGPTGRGTPEHCGVLSRVDVINSTLGKALGGATGGYTTGPKPLIDLLRQRSRPYLFSNSLAPCVAGASLAVFDRISSDSSLRDALMKNTAHFRSRMSRAGFTLGGQTHPIVPIMLGDARLASEIAEDLLHRGIYVIGFSFPVVPKGKARIRVQLSAAHSLKDVDRCADAFIEVGKTRRIIG